MASVSIVIPTYEEAANIPLLLRRLSIALRDVDCGVLVVDDSPSDETCKATVGAAVMYGIERFRVGCYRREAAEMWGGLSGAVIDGINRTDESLVIVMDGDLQHPPELTVEMIAVAESQHCDLVLASRYCDGGSCVGLSSPLRLVVSKACTLIAKMLFPRAMKDVDDPMTGFFLVRRRAIDTTLLQPEGFKILLEILVQHPQLSRQQVPLVFASREAGESKGDFSQGFAYLSQIARLRFG